MLHHKLTKPASQDSQAMNQVHRDKVATTATYMHKHGSLEKH